MPFTSTSYQLALSFSTRGRSYERGGLERGRRCRQDLVKLLVLAVAVAVLCVEMTE